MFKATITSGGHESNATNVVVLVLETPNEDNP